ncbi:hypothetical protein [Acetobacter syzygii]|uniref:Glycerophosphodiester phosphodiesterase n=1 Tax=Acetobacter syzygii TaxID=146476 RepID=A0A270BTY5_9PROT|nr:hypothetical protein [Acetobacter syzygii]PAL28304.1 hypothetical protein B9K05_03205 [Acetobacter syzygii]PAL28732.1 hypothetical protein B9K04_01190 [Acetobacter syzygii]
MSHPEKGDGISVCCNATSSRRCLKKIAFAATLCVASVTLLAIHHTKTSGIMARIHHGLIMCASNTGTQNIAQAATISSIERPSMVRLSLTSGADGQVDVEPGSSSLATVLDTASHSNTLLMLDLHGTDPKKVARQVSKAHMRDRVIFVPADYKDAAAALKADSKVMVAIHVNSKRDAYNAHRMAGRHPYAAYLSPSASPSLFSLVHRDAEAIITDTPSSQVSTADFLANRPVDIMITHQPYQLTTSLAAPLAHAE